MVTLRGFFEGNERILHLSIIDPKMNGVLQETICRTEEVKLGTQARAWSTNKVKLGGRRLCVDVNIRGQT